MGLECEWKYWSRVCNCGMSEQLNCKSILDRFREQNRKSYWEAKRRHGDLSSYCFAKESEGFHNTSLINIATTLSWEIIWGAESILLEQWTDLKRNFCFYNLKCVFKRKTSLVLPVLRKKMFVDLTLESLGRSAGSSYPNYSGFFVVIEKKNHSDKLQSTA